MLTLDKKIAKVVRLMMVEREMYQGDISNISQTTVSITLKVGVKTIATLEKFSNAFRVPVSEIIRRAEELQ